MYKRQKVILHLLLESKKPPTRVGLMKCLFLLKHERNIDKHLPFYDFVPYKFGPFSFLLYRELDALRTEGYIEQGILRPAKRRKREVESLVDTLSCEVREQIALVLREYSSLANKELLTHVYSNYPWFASRSQLTTRATPTSQPDHCIFTVGYEGRSIDALMDLLLRNGISAITDVRRNAYSRKYGYSKRVLQRICARVGIRYVHTPLLGIPSALRRNLKSRADYARLFRYYESEILSDKAQEIGRVGQLTFEQPTALMCYEADSSSCHREHLAERLAQDTGFSIEHL